MKTQVELGCEKPSRCADVCAHLVSGMPASLPACLPTWTAADLCPPDTRLCESMQIIK